LFKLVLEAYLEPLGDLRSFGFRPGRGCSHAIAEVANLLRSLEYNRNITRNSCVLRILNKKSKNIFYAQSLIIEGNITGYFNNISHS
jgi:retron-type reverse transcriptase